MTQFDPYASYIELGDQPVGQTDYIEQNGIVFVWSESNIEYTAILRLPDQRLVNDILWERIMRQHGSIPTERRERTVTGRTQSSPNMQGLNPHTPESQAIRDALKR